MFLADKGRRVLAVGGVVRPAEKECGGERGGGKEPSDVAVFPLASSAYCMSGCTRLTGA